MITVHPSLFSRTANLSTSSSTSSSPHSTLSLTSAVKLLTLFLTSFSLKSKTPPLVTTLDEQGVLIYVGGYIDDTIDRELILKVIVVESVKEIKGGSFRHKQGVFEGCYNLDSVIFEHNPDTEDCACTSIGIRAFWECYSLRSLVVPDSVKVIEDYAFFRCGLERIEMSDSVHTLGDGCFQGCTELKFFHIPASLTSLNNGIFSKCTSLSVVTSSQDNSELKEIRYQAFLKCASLVNMSISERCTDVLQDAFLDCASLAEKSSEGGFDTAELYLRYRFLLGKRAVFIRGLLMAFNRCDDRRVAYGDINDNNGDGIGVNSNDVDVGLYRRIGSGDLWRKVLEFLPVV